MSASIAMRPRLRALVVDTAALIENVRLDQYADVLVTVPDVLAEVRNEHARRQLELQLQPIETRQPSPESVNFVAEFAKKTGDYASLSAVDLRVLALTYMLEREYAGGDGHLRKEPQAQVVVHAPVGAESSGPRIELPGFYMPPGHHQSPHEHDSDTVASPSMEMDQPDDGEDGWISVSNRRRRREGARSAPRPSPTAPVIAAQPQSQANLATVAKEGEKEEEDGEDGEDDDDDNGWITPANVEEAKEQHNTLGKTTGELATSLSQVGCITADFAMQNVLLQIGLHIQDIHGRVIRFAKTFVLRCHACLKSTTDMTRKFCPTCGNNTLIRTSVSIGPDGVMQYHLKANFQYNLRGTKYSIPDTKGGRNAKNLILREDQKEYMQATSRAKRVEKMDFSDPDYVSPLVSGSSRSDVPHGAHGARIGYGRKNPNEPKRYTSKKSKAKQNA